MTKRGHWQLQKTCMEERPYTLFKGDCLDVLRNVPDHTVDLVLADPPYGTTRYAWDSVIDVEAMWKEVKRVLKPAGVVVLWAKQPFSSVLVHSNLEMFKLSLVWNKNRASNHMQAKRRPLQIHEDLLVFYSTGSPTYNPQMTKGHDPYLLPRKRSQSVYHWHKTKPFEHVNAGKAITTRYPTSIIEVPRVSSGGRLHKTQKPVPLAEWLIRTYSNPAEIVLDFCMGSGTTGVGAINTDRFFIGCELDPKHFANALIRLDTAYTNKEV